jgi:ribosomal silencing factor RsfS
MAQNSLISDIRLEYKELESMRKNLITKTLQSQRQISAQIEHLKAEFKENVKILESLAEETSTSKQEPQPEGKSI